MRDVLANDWREARERFASEREDSRRNGTENQLDLNFQGLTGSIGAEHFPFTPMQESSLNQKGAPSYDDACWH